VKNSEYFAYVAKGGKIPFEDWVKTAKCDECGLIGHIRPNCPKRPPRKKNIRGDRDRDAKRGGDRDRGRNNRNNRPPLNKESKASRDHQREVGRALIAKADDESDGNNDSSSDSDEDNDSEVHHALTARMGLTSMLGSLKE
jgi:hypothetical protein